MAVLLSRSHDITVAVSEPLFDWVAVDIGSGDSEFHPLYAVSSVLTVVPEPSSFLLLGLGGIGALGVVRRRRRKQADHS